MLGNDSAVYLRTYAHLYPHDLRGEAGALDRMRSPDTDAQDGDGADSSIGSAPKVG
jgi:hypothetical protein